MVLQNDGKVLVTFPSGGGAATALALMPDGRIVVAGDANGSVAVARYLPDGQPDPTFDFDGLLVDPGANGIPTGAHVGADALQTDMRQVADEPLVAGATECQREAEQCPQHREQPHGREVLHQHPEDVVAALDLPLRVRRAVRTRLLFVDTPPIAR